MNISVYQQSINLIVFILTGIIIGVLFDIFRIMRKSFKTPDIVTYIEDIIFWILTGLILLFTIFTFNNGEIRIYIFVGLLLGLCIYMLTLSKYFVKVNILIISAIKKVLYFPIKEIVKVINMCIIRPFKFLIKKAKEIMTKWIKKPIKETGKANSPK